MQTIQKQSTKELEQKYQQLYDMIENVDCFGVQDLLEMTALEKELEKRGVEMEKLIFFKD